MSDGLRNPQGRRELLALLPHFADSEYQESVWIGREASSADDSVWLFDDSVNDLFMLIEPAPEPGDILLNGEEVRAVTDLHDAALCVFPGYGDMRTFAEVREDPHWPALMDAAAQALRVLRRVESSTSS